MAVTINFNTLRQRASQFAKDFEGVTSEKKVIKILCGGFAPSLALIPVTTCPEETTNQQLTSFEQQ